MSPLSPIRSILVYTDGEVIGDGILKLPVAAALKQALPDARLTWLTSKPTVYSSALADIARTAIDELIILPDTYGLPAADYLRRPHVLRHHDYDLIIDSQFNVKRTLWLKRIRHQRFMSAAAGGLLSHPSTPRSLSLHVFERLLQLASRGVDQPLYAPTITLPSPEWDAKAAAMLPGDARYIGFVVGAGHPDKCWPLSQFIALAQQVASKGSTPVVFLGPNEQLYAATIRQALPYAIFPLAASGPNASPYLTIALAKHLTAAVANDSGGCHLLAAGGAPLVTLFRASSVRDKFMPRSSRVIALAPQDFGCTSMSDIPPYAITDALARLI